MLTWRMRTPDMFEHSETRTREWKCKIWNSAWAGKATGSKKSQGYLCVGLVPHGRLSAHRIAWAIHYGVWPKGEVDHINGDTSDNRIKNLRAVSTSENSKNKSKYRNNTSGITGVSYHKGIRQWTAGIRVDGKRIHLGAFDEKEDAILARMNGEKEYEFHENHGRQST